MNPGFAVANCVVLQKLDGLLAVCVAGGGRCWRCFCSRCCKLLLPAVARKSSVSEDLVAVWLKCVCIADYKSSATSAPASTPALASTIVLASASAEGLLL